MAEPTRLSIPPIEWLSSSGCSSSPEAHNVAGYSGGDRYAGTKFGDVVRGRGGDDVLNGRGGDDRITGGLGADKLTGGGKADTFIFTSARETSGDLIRDFDPSENDRIKL